MLKNYLKFAIRSLLKNKVVSSINVLGLGLGLTVAVFVFLYTEYELSFDQWVTDKNQIYRVYRQWEGGNGNTFTPSPAATLLQEKVAGVSSATRVNTYHDMVLDSEGEQYRVPVVYSVDSNFFKTIPLGLQFGGDVATVFKQLDVAVLSNHLAKQIFGEKNPVGATLLLENSHLLQVVGVLSPFEGPTHLEADLYVHEKLGTTSWTGAMGNIYVKIKPQVAADQVAASFTQLANEEIAIALRKKNKEADPAKMAEWRLQPITSIHLGSAAIGGEGLITGSYRMVGIMLLLGVMVLALAIINYINLATARLKEKAAEVGVRKVIGANRKSLIGQFMTESLISVLLSFLLALAVAQIFMPYFNDIMGRALDIGILIDWKSLALMSVLLLVVGAMTGFFPAFYYAGLSPMDSIKGQRVKGDKTRNYRNVLVVFQFSLSVGLILFVSVVWTQVDFMLQKELGFKGDQIAAFRLNTERAVERFNLEKARILDIPGVEAVSQTARPPGSFIPNYALDFEGSTDNHGADMFFVDTDWNKAFNVPIMEGRFFSDQFALDTLNAFVVNETFVKRYNMENPIGHRMKFPSDEQYGQIVGVIKDFHYRGLQDQIGPLALSARHDLTWMGNVAVRINNQQIASALPQLEQAWKAIEPGFPVTFNFLDQQFEAQYAAYIRFGKSLLYTTICCIIIAMLGLLGLTFFMTQQRVKEIGIRKILGASIGSIITLLSKDLVRLVTIGVILAIPVALYFANQWLEAFAYRTAIHWWVVMGIGLGTLLFAFLTTSFQTLKVASANPVNALRDE